VAERVCLYAIVSGTERRPRGRAAEGERQLASGAGGERRLATGAGGERRLATGAGGERRLATGAGGERRLATGAGSERRLATGAGNEWRLATGAGGERLRLTGVGGERLRVVRMAGVEAVIGVMPRAIRPTMAAVRRYDEVERALMARYASVLPARFGTCAATLDLLAAAVRDRRDGIRRSLRLVRGRVQMTVRLFSGSESVQSHPVQSGFRTGSEYGDAARGTEYLRRRWEETQIPGAATLRPAVARWVRAERSERHAGGQLAGTLYHLVPRGAVSAYRRGISRAATEAGLTTIVSGPWAPYAFADIDIGS
jgi:hypothetical protein